VQFSLISDVTFGGVLAIPRGATVHGVVTESKKAGELGGSAVLALTLTSLDLGGQSYPLTTDQFRVKGPNKAGQTVGNALGAGVVGTIIGCAVGRGMGCAVGAGAGVAAGTAASAASPGPGVWIPAEAQVTFHLKAPVTVDPVSPQEAARLAQGLYQGGPSLYRRPSPYGVRYYNGYGYYPYGYPPVYYRPYIMTGGFYYWR
jgi:guanyl-specific ribonuclease Sa